MTTIEQDYINALLADASYVRELVANAPTAYLSRAISARMTPGLAESIASNFEVASHIESDDRIGSGFDATVWRGRAGTPYAGRVYVSMRGTLGLQDLLTDVKLALSGDGGQQVADMVNWWLRITTPVGQNARQIGHTVDAVSGFISPAADGRSYHRCKASNLLLKPPHAL